MKLARLIKMFLNETFGRVRLSRYLSDMFPNKNGLGGKRYVLSSLLFNFALEYAIRRFQVNQDGFKLNGTQQLLVYGDDVNILGRSFHVLNKNSDAILVAIQETGLDVNAD
jgi:hypothetical protein